VFDLGSTACRMDASRFFAYAKSGFSSYLKSQWCHRCAQPTSTDSGQSHRSNDAFTDSLAQSVQKVWQLIAFFVKKGPVLDLRGFN